MAINLRSMFKTIFGTPKDTSEEYSIYRLLNTYQNSITPFNGDVWDTNTGRAAVDAFARRAAKVMPRHVRVSGALIDEVPQSRYNRLLQHAPNTIMPAYALWYRVAADYLIHNNAYIYPHYDGGTLTALYAIEAQTIELLEQSGGIYARFVFGTGQRKCIPYEQLIHIRRHFAKNDFFGDDNTPLHPVMLTAHTFNESMCKYAGLIGAIRGILKIVVGGMKDEDLAAHRNRFVRDNLKLSNNGSGVIVTDAKQEYIPATEKSTPIPTSQLEYIKAEIYEYFGISSAIVNGTATHDEEAEFTASAISPFYVQLTQAVTNCLFTETEKGYGNKIIFETENLANASIADKMTVAKFLTEIGALSLDQALIMFGLPPVGGEEGARKVQTLNMVNAALADKYQVGAEAEGE